MPASENSDGGDGGVGGWPDGVDGGVLYQLADYHWAVKRSLRAAAFCWNEAGTAERAAFLDELDALRAKEQEIWDAHVARPVKGTP